jgi:hypothetical protein
MVIAILLTIGGIRCQGTDINNLSGIGIFLIGIGGLSLFCLGIVLICMVHDMEFAKTGEGETPKVPSKAVHTIVEALDKSEQLIEWYQEQSINAKAVV